MRRNSVECILPALYNSCGIEAADDAAKQKLFVNTTDTYYNNIQWVFTTTYTMFGVDKNRKNNITRFAKVAEVVYDENDAPFFKFFISENLKKLVEQIPEPVIVCTVIRDQKEDGTYVARQPMYTLYNYADYIEEEKRKLESKIFRKGSVFPRNNKGLSSTIQERVNEGYTEDKSEATQYTPVATNDKSAEQALAEKMQQEANRLMKAIQPNIVFSL